MTEQTTYSNRCKILSDLWLQYTDEESLQDFFSYNDLGLSLAFAISEGIVESTQLAEGYVNETFDLLLEATGLEDAGFEDLDQIFAI